MRAQPRCRQNMAAHAYGIQCVCCVGGLTLCQPLQLTLDPHRSAAARVSPLCFSLAMACDGAAAPCVLLQITAWIILAAEWGVFMLLAWYLEQVLDTGNGAPRHPLFFLRCLFPRKVWSHSSVTLLYHFLTSRAATQPHLAAPVLLVAGTAAPDGGRLHRLRQEDPRE